MSSQPDPAARDLTVEVGRTTVRLQGRLARIVAYLLTTADLAAQIERTSGGSLSVTWGAGGSYTGWVQTHYPKAQSSSLGPEDDH